MAKDQEWVNRSHGQKLRRLNEVLEEQGTAIDYALELTLQNARDIRVLKAIEKDRAAERDAYNL
jgi:hypothetical protein